MLKKNKAKCAKCSSIIESFHNLDYVICECGEISLDGGEAMKCYAKDFSNFIRIDENGNEIKPRIIEFNLLNKVNNQLPVLKKDEPSEKEELLHTLDNLIATLDILPSNLMQNPVNHYDYYSLLLLFKSFLKLDCNRDI